MSELVLLKDNQPIDLNQMPSLLAALHANSRAVVSTQDEITQTKLEIAELRERLTAYVDLGVPTKGVLSALTRRERRIEELECRLEAHEAHYIEVPDLGGVQIKMDDGRWGHRLGTDVPMDVVRALQHARDSGLFDEFRIYTPTSRRRDPMIVGAAGDAVFYIASWR